MVILYSTFTEGMSRQMERFATEVSTGHLQLHRQRYIADQDLYAQLPETWVHRLEQYRLGQPLPQFHLAPRLYAAGLASSEQASSGVMIKAIDPQREAKATRLLQHLRSGQADFSLQQNDLASQQSSPIYGVMVGVQLARTMHLQPGSELVLVTQAADGSIGNALFKVSAILSPIDPAFDRTGVLMSIASYRSLMALPSGIHELVVTLDNSEQLEAVQQAIQHALAQWQQSDPINEWGGDVVVRNWRQITPAIADMVSLSESMVWVIGSIIIGLASLGMLNTMLMAIHERTHEFGILLAIGMKRRWLMLMVLLESFLLALIAALAGSFLGGLLGYYVEINGLDFSASMPDGYDWGGIAFEPIMEGYLRGQNVLSACLLMMVISLVASLLPSWRTVRLQPAEAMR